MPFRRDLATARKLVVEALHARRLQRRLWPLYRERERLERGEAKVAVYFADSDVNMYQIRQWYAPLAELHKTHPVTIIARHPTAALALLQESPVPIVYARKVAQLEEFIDQQELRVVLYVNQNAKNFQMMRYGRMWHVFVNHGESDKMYMTTNQFKAYDYAFVAGDAALERLGKVLWDYDFDKRAIAIGRPQADHFAGELPYVPDDRTVVLYAPTWEGDRPAAAYGSIATHGRELVRALTATGRHRVIYRPHPRSGVLDAEYGRAHREIVAEIDRANAADPGAQHVFDDGPEMGWQLAAADVAVCDISAMVYDRLATGKPILVTRPAHPEASVDESGYLGAAEWLTVEGATDAVAELDRVLGSSAAQERLQHWVHRHFGDTAPGAATSRFHAAIERLMDAWDRHARLHEATTLPSASDPSSQHPLRQAG